MARRKRHLLTAIGLLLCTAGLGAAITTLFARSLLLSTTTARLKAYAGNYLEQDDKLAANINTTLNQADASPFPSCSEPDLTLLRNLLFRSPFLKDVGREHDGHFFCSAIAGKLARPTSLNHPDLKAPNNRVIYYNVPLNVAKDFRGEIVASSRSNVVLSPDIFNELHRPPLFFSGAVIDRDRHTMLTTFSNAPQPPTIDLMLSGRTIDTGGNLLFSECSSVRPSCVLTGIPVKYVWAPNRPIIVASIVLGALIGLSFSGTALFMDRRRKSVSSQLRRAIRKDELTVLYQPVVEILSGEIVGAEALVRWNDEEGEAVRPELFIAIAEEHGFVAEITTFVLDRVLHDFADFLRATPRFRVSINMSAQDLTDPTFIPRLDHTLRVHRVPASSIGLELTERSTADRTHVIETIRKLRARGHVIYIDDFGTGYSSLAYLSELSVDILKVDRAFTRTIGTGSIIASILPQILAMARALNLDIIVEGVEFPEQAEYLAEVGGLIHAQGWLFGEPCEPRELKARLAKSLMYESSIH